MNPVAVHFGENLRRLRKRAEISQEELGHRASLHRTEIGLLERGARVPRIDTLIKIASALGIHPNALMAGISWTPAEAGAAGEFKVKSRIEQHREAMELAAKAREGQTETVDAVELVHEARDELAERTERWKEER
ncbi:MAG: helix-turn-helix transcriptional regulator [Solirubrobacterales bacterium]